MKLDKQYTSSSGNNNANANGKKNDYETNPNTKGKEITIRSKLKTENNVLVNPSNIKLISQTIDM